jgi:ABC-2 type transport system permease protein
MVTMSFQNKNKSLFYFFISIGILLFINILSSFIYTKIDLTEDRRFTMNKATDALLRSLKNDTSTFTIEIYLEGEFPSEFKHLKSAVIDLLTVFREKSGNLVDFRFYNPLQGSDEERKDMQTKLSKQGIMPLQIMDKRQAKLMLVFPSAIIRYGNKFQVVQLMELGDGYFQPSDIDPSINFLEYKFAAAIQKLKQKNRSRLVLLTGHGELARPYTNELEKSLFEYYDIARLNLSDVNQIDSNIHLVIVQKPQSEFTPDDQFKIDQYIMNGGKLLWMVDGLQMEDDSLRNKEGQAVPFESSTDLQRFLFNYGVRLNYNLIASYDAASILGLQTSQGQKSNPKWFYYPLVYPFQTPIEAQSSGKSTIDHPIVKNIDFVLTKYASSLDTVITKGQVLKTVLLRSSKYSRVQYPPTPISLQSIDPAIRADAFTKGNQNVAILLEGNFESYFRNRIPVEVANKWSQIGNYPIRDKGNRSKMIVISDGEIGKNEVYPSSGKTVPIGAGYHPETGPRVFSNKEFIMNSVEYLLDETGLISARSKEIKLRPLDQERAMQEELKWQLINMGIPLLFVLIFGLFFYQWRKRKYK